MKRKEFRETAFALLYEWSFESNRTIDEIIEIAKESRDIEADDYLYKVIGFVTEHLGEIDKHIQAYSTKWKIGRISKISLAALRLSIAEILYIPEIPQGASINEAIELVKKFGAEEESAYLNGVLGGFVRAECEEETK